MGRDCAPAIDGEVRAAVMNSQADDHDRSLAFAQIALGQIKALRQTATPRNYEIWYSYASGYNPSLNQAINEILTRSKNLTEEELERIYETYLSPARITDRIDNVGSRVSDEISQVMAMIDAAAGTASNYSESLAGMSEKISSAKDREGLRSIVESLVETTNEMQETNESLEQKLTASKQEINQLQVNLETVRTESLTDPMTGLANRKFFDDTLDNAISDAGAREEPLSLLMVDIDHFKTFNDTYGHLTGDQVLRLVASSLKQNVKGQDVAARYGGEEFVVVLPNTPLRSALTVADHIRRAVMSKELMKRSTGQHLGRITVSIGAATMHKGDTAQSFIGRADACLYSAKRNGRNRVVCETDPEMLADTPSKVA
jgi:diguanylate cyclase